MLIIFLVSCSHINPGSRLFIHGIHAAADGTQYREAEKLNCYGRMLSDIILWHDQHSRSAHPSARPLSS